MKKANAATIKRHPKEGRKRVWFARICLFVLASALSTAVIVVEPEPVFQGREFAVGEPASRTFFSPIHLTYVDEAVTDRLRQGKVEQVPIVFSLDADAGKGITEKADLFFEKLHEAKQRQADAAAEEKPGPLLPLSKSTLKLLMEEDVLEDVRKNLEIVIERNLMLGMLSYRDKEQLREAGIRTVTILNPQTKVEKVVAVKDLWTLANARESAVEVLPASVAKKRALRDAILDVFNTVMVPNMVRDEAETVSRRQAAFHSVPDAEFEIKKDELVVQRGILITPEIKQRLNLIQNKMVKRQAINKFLAIGLIVFLAYAIMLIYLNIFEKKRLLSFGMLLQMHAVILMNIFLCKLVLQWPDVSPYCMPTPLASLVLTLLISGRIGFLGTFMMTVLAAPLAEFDAGVIFATLFAGVFGIFVARRVIKRIQFLKVGAAVGLGYGIVVFAVNRFQDYSVSDSAEMASWGVGSGLLITAPLCFFLVVPVMEALFGSVTDITLLELSDLNHPLLKRMVIEAPGTYHHSLVVSRLAESASESIGANALLARVGAYFHDIGKIPNAQFFTENQGKAVSKHDKLTPAMSFLMISNHVKDGMRLGRHHKLKKPILDFIPEHHGTGLVYYFYRKAIDTVRPAERVHADDFRYSGPKPQSRETAIALLADSAEAASRSLADPTPENLQQVVRKVINEKFIDGQLDECDLTLRDLHRIQKSFVNNLNAIYHTRISYPAIEEAFDKPDLFEDSQFSKFRVES